MMLLNPNILDESCGCGSGKAYKLCCYPYHSGEQFAPTAEALMRSRFVAYQQKLDKYLIQTWDDETCPDDLSAEGVEWIRLTISGRKKGRKKDQEGWVTFSAYYLADGKEGSMLEKSYFIKDVQGRWRYVRGEIR